MTHPLHASPFRAIDQASAVAALLEDNTQRKNFWATQEDIETEPSPSPLAFGLITSIALTACGGGGSGAGSGNGIGVTTPNALTGQLGYLYPAAGSDAEAARFLQQAQFSSTGLEVAGVRTGSYTDWLKRQFDLPIAQTGFAWLDARGYGADAVADKNVYNEAIADFMVWKDLFSSPDAMRKRVSLALSEFFVVSFSSMEIDWRGYAMAAYWDVLNQNAFGNYRALLEDITLNPAMGYFLNTRGNQKEDGKGRQPDENYAREVMQLFTIGLYELNLDSTEKRDGAGKRIETYDTDDVSQLARVFTGYDFDPAYRDKVSPSAFTYKIWSREYARRRMVLDPARHSNLAASFLNTHISANTPGASALKAALDGLFNHANTAPFFAKQMIQRLVTSNPSPAYVSRVAKTFIDNGAGIRGDLKAVWAAILLDNDARDPTLALGAGFGKVREPMVRFVQWGRSFGLKSLQNSWKLFDQSNPSYALGQSPLRSPSVFNFFRPGYVPPNTAMAAQSAPAPEFQIVNETTVGAYINFMQNTIPRGIETSRPDVPEVFYDMRVLDLVPDYSAEFALINNTAFTTAEADRVALALVQRLNQLLCANAMTVATQTEIRNALRAAIVQKKIVVGSLETLKRDLVAAAILMTMSCPDYLVQK